MRVEECMVVKQILQEKFSSRQVKSIVFVIIFVSCYLGLGGMSGAQAKAATITGVVGIIAEIDKSHLIKRKNQGWLDEYYDNVDKLVDRVRECKAAKKAISIGYHGNVVDIWEKLAEIHKNTGEQIVDLGSDQTSCHDIKG